MKNKTILVTGANGYIGRHVVKYLLNLGMRVIALDVNFEDVDNRAEIIKADIFSSNLDLESIIKKTDICLHLAWRNGFVHNSGSHILDLPYHYNFVRNMIGQGLQHIAILGSMHEVGYWEGAVDENTPTNPTTLYGIAKNSLRQSVQVLKDDVNFTFQWLRAFYIIGDDLRNHSVFTKLVKSAKEGFKTFPVTKAETKFDFITIDELAKQISLSINQKKINGIINCCSGNPISLQSAIDNFIIEKHLDITPEYGKYPENPHISSAIWGNNNKILEIINDYQTDLSTGENFDTETD